jgi:hypothetical protein
MMTTTLRCHCTAGTAPPDGCPSALTALAYADDVTALSTPEDCNIQSMLWPTMVTSKWNCNVVKSVCITFPDLRARCRFGVARA